MTTKTLMMALCAVALSACISTSQFHTPETPPRRQAIDSTLFGLGQPMEGVSRRASSSALDWRDSNGDARGIAPGDTLTFAELDGPGRVRHLWFTVACQDPQYSAKLTLRIYWDGAETPSVETPLGDFFAVGHGRRAWVDSQMVAVSSNGRAYNCYWPMPFLKGARMTLTNESDQGLGVYWYVDWEQLEALPPDTPYFHAQYRQEFPCNDGDYLILDTEGRGYYVGTVLSVRKRGDGWFGEGDDRFYIDGDPEPTLRGTGTEDYFCDAWGFRQFTHPFYGLPIWEGDRAGDRGTAYRWHVADPVKFNQSLKVTIEHKGPWVDPETREMVTFYDERPDDFSSVAFWYQTGQATRFTQLPPGAQRVHPCVRLEAEEMAIVSEVKPGVQKGDLWHRGAQLFWMNGEGVGAEIEAEFTVDHSEYYSIELLATFARDYGIFEIALDDETLHSGADFYADPTIIKPLQLGAHRIEAGTHTLRFKCVGANPQSHLYDNSGPGHFLGIDTVELWPLDTTGAPTGSGSSDNNE